MAEDAGRLASEDPFACLLSEDVTPQWLQRLPRVRFVEEGHLYFLDGSKQRIISATTLLKQYWAPFDPEGVVARWYDSWQRKPSSKYYGMSREAILESWKDTSAADLGTAMHGQIERHLRAMPFEPGWTWESPELKAYARFREDTQVWLEPVATEMVVFDETLRLCGSIDLVARNKITGELVLGDWKRAKKTISNKALPYRGQKGLMDVAGDLDDTNYNHYCLQLNLYREIIETRMGERVGFMFLVRIHPDAAEDPDMARGYHLQPVEDMRERVGLAFARRRRELAKARWRLVFAAVTLLGLRTLNLE